MKSNFISEPKTNIEILHESFMKEFKLKFENEDINSKNYSVTLIRNLMLYFYYKAYKSKIISRNDILSMFANSDISLVYKNYKIIKSSIKNPKIQQNKLEIFKYFYYSFSKIYTDNLITYKKIQIDIPIDQYNRLTNDPNFFYVNPLHYEVRTTQFKGIYKILNLSNGIRYTASKETLKNHKLIISNLTHREFYNKNNTKDYPISIESDYYLNLLSHEVENIFFYIENYHPGLLKADI